MPVQQSIDLEVQARAQDRGKAADVARRAAQMANSGQTNVTVNHSGGWKEQVSKLRTRRKIREMVDEG